METNSADSLLDRVRSVIASETSIAVEELKSSTALASLVTDSLEMVNLVMELEGEFGLTLEESDFEKILTIQDVVKYIEKNRVEAA
jgi:acyl carrier protein